MHPEAYFHRLKEAMFDLETLKRTKYFAECRADIDGESVMLYAPITPQSLAMVHNANSAIAPQCRHIQRLDILEGEMLCTGFGKRYCPIIIERLPEGILLRDALYTHTISTLKRGFEALRNELESHDISINHLHPNSIIVDRVHHWHIIRPYYATCGYGNDTEAFDKLAELIARYTQPSTIAEDCLHEEFAPYGASEDSGRTVYAASEGIRRFETAEGYGFEDENGRIVIGAIYHNASDFLEDRAIVESHDHKWGMIDRCGRYIIDMKYDSIEFNVDDGTSAVTLNGRTATFDYFGIQIPPWQ
jgi:hypothetical protein